MGCPTAYSESDLDLLEEIAVRQARESFWPYLQYMMPDAKKGWWQWHAAQQMMTWYAAFLRCERPILVIEAPPQHGKSYLVVLFLSWMAGKNPNWKQIYASFSERLGVRANGDLQRLFDSDRYKRVFPDTAIGYSNAVTLANRAKRNSSLIEFVQREGSFYNTTVLGEITGQGMHIGAMDDPLKGREAAKSPTIRDKTWNWFVDDFFTRLDEMAGLIAILTRWDIDDPIGRLMERSPGRVIRLQYPALAEPGAHLMEADPREAGSGEPLFPEHKSREFLLEQKAVRTDPSWQSLYQQNPLPDTGGDFQPDNIQFIDALPASMDMVRGWDLAASTAKKSDYTATVWMGIQDGITYIAHIERGQWQPDHVERRIKQLADADGKGTLTSYPQDPGQAGKMQVQRIAKLLQGHRFESSPESGDKRTRAGGIAAQVNAGNVRLVNQDQSKEFLDELATFPNGPHADFVDALSRAYNRATEGTYTLENI